MSDLESGRKETREGVVAAMAVFRGGQRTVFKQGEEPLAPLRVPSPPPALSAAAIEQGLTRFRLAPPGIRLSEKPAPFLRLTPREPYVDGRGWLGLYEAHFVLPVPPFTSSGEPIVSYSTPHVETPIAEIRTSAFVDFKPEGAGKRYLIDWSIHTASSPTSLILSGPGAFQLVTVQGGSHHVTALFEASGSSWQRFYLQRSSTGPGGTFFLFWCEVVAL
jgi:hypothetical protein